MSNDTISSLYEAANGFSSSHQGAGLITANDTSFDQLDSGRFSFKVRHASSSTPIESPAVASSVFKSSLPARAHEIRRQAEKVRECVRGIISLITGPSVQADILDLNESMSLTMPRGMFPERIQEGDTFEFFVSRDQDGIATPEIRMKAVESTEEAKAAHRLLAELYGRF